MARAKEEKGDFLKRGKLWLNAFLNPFFSFSFREKGKRTAFSFCFSKKKTSGKRKKRPGKPFGWFPRTPSIDQSLALDLRRMEVGESTIDFVGADAERICNAPSSRTAALSIGPYRHERSAAGWREMKIVGEN